MPLKQSSSSDDDEDQAKFLSVAIDSAAVVQSASTSKAKSRAGSKGQNIAASSESEGEENGGLKHYQVKAQDALHSFLDATFGSLISAVDTLGSGTSSSSESESEAPPESEKKARKGAPGIQLFGRLPKRKPAAEAPKPVHKRQVEEEHEFDEDDIEVRKKLMAAAVDPDIIWKGADQAAAQAADNAKAEEARRLKELTNEGQRLAKLKQERGVAQLVKGRIVIIKEPAENEERKRSCDEEGGKKKKKRRRAEDEVNKTGAGLEETNEVGKKGEAKRRKKKKKRTSIEEADGMA